MLIMRNPAILTILKERIGNIYTYRHTLWDTSVKQLKSKYAGSIMGIWLAVINPMLIMLAITFVFNAVFKLGIKDFALFALSGIFPWMFFSCALFEATSSILNQQRILHQFNLPREIIPLSSVLANFLNFLIGWCIIYPLFIILHPKVILLLPLLILILLLNLLIVCGLGLLLSVVNVLFHDIGHLLGVIMMFWFWVTPIFYSADMIPARFRWICIVNPMAPYIIYYRDILFRVKVPEFSVFAGVSLWGILCLITGLTVFAYLEPKLLKQV